MTDMTVAPTAPADLGDLPRWDLTDLYAGRNDPQLEADLAEAAQTARAFKADWQGRLATMAPSEFGRAVRAYEALTEQMQRVISFAQLQHAENVTSPEAGRFFQDIQERLTEIGRDTLFFTLELNRLSDGELQEKLAEPVVARYRPWLETVRQFRPHQLDDRLEQVLHDKEVAGAAAWVRLFDETTAGMLFDVDGESLGLTQTLDRLSDPDRTRRRAAGQAVARGLADNIRLFALITNTLAKDKQIEDTWRQYPNPISYRNLANQVEDSVVDALVAAVKAAYPRLSHRYYAMKARWLGLERLSFWDRNAPLPEADDRRYTWREARGMVLDAYGRFSGRLAEVGQTFFDRAWIDAPASAGKAPGAFAHPTVPSAHPYLLLHYMGRARDVMTLAHELGHGCHQVLAGPQGTLLSNTPLTLAETASVFGEMLTFRALLDAEADPVRRKVLLATKVEDMLNTVVRQIAFHEFERQVHTRRRSGELSEEALGDIWMQVQTDSLGPAFDFGDEYRVFWAYIPHFIHAPFYVYAYAFGDCLVNSLYGVYQSGDPDFERKYMEMLAAGGAKRHRELLAPFGLDASDPAFWRRGLDVISGLIDELEAMA